MLLELLSTNHRIFVVTCHKTIQKTSCTPNFDYSSCHLINSRRKQKKTKENKFHIHSQPRLRIVNFFFLLALYVFSFYDHL
ncbi:uncharacterized protein BYT42DRAFT_565930 [Radiomyces spectabilis]|uniref:uncharacterized protein n=1 Tax=Radiomyces spectabilis TaxID=64574 RepID=UPI002220531B|nr:uncharacterized protein BYT42DRAFT_565930 [Radiomyces spectabilis]KAI8381276.1 hypothetical protein BYT42DRAFT_565930 [Radiomyces spectabilis]